MRYRLLPISLILILIFIGSMGWARCASLCDIYWWKRADVSDVQAALYAGADVNGRNKFGYRPLHWAVWISFPDAVQVLLDAGAKISVRDTLWDTPLHVAAWAGSSENVLLLLRAGADAKAKNKDQKTPWDLAQDNEKLRDTEGYFALMAAYY